MTIAAYQTLYESRSVVDWVTLLWRDMSCCKKAHVVVVEMKVVLHIMSVGVVYHTQVAHRWL